MPTRLSKSLDDAPGQQKPPSPFGRATYSYALLGTGTTSQLAAELFKRSRGLALVHVPLWRAPIFAFQNGGTSSTVGFL